MSYELVEVRCCCQPMKLLGWMRCKEGTLRTATRLTFQEPERFDHSAMWLGPGPICPRKPKGFTLPIEFVAIGSHRYKAIKAEGMTIEQLSRIREFIPATDATKGA